MTSGERMEQEWSGRSFIVIFVPGQADRGLIWPVILSLGRGILGCFWLCVFVIFVIRLGIPGERLIPRFLFDWLDGS